MIMASLQSATLSSSCNSHVMSPFHPERRPIPKPSQACTKPERHLFPTICSLLHSKGLIALDEARALTSALIDTVYVYVCAKIPYCTTYMILQIHSFVMSYSCVVYGTPYVILSQASLPTHRSPKQLSSPYQAQVDSSSCSSSRSSFETDLISSLAPALSPLLLCYRLL